MLGSIIVLFVIYAINFSQFNSEDNFLDEIKNNSLVKFLSIVSIILLSLFSLFNIILFIMNQTKLNLDSEYPNYSELYLLFNCFISPILYLGLISYLVLLLIYKDKLLETSLFGNLNKVLLGLGLINLIINSYFVYVSYKANYTYCNLAYYGNIGLVIAPLIYLNKKISLDIKDDSKFSCNVLVNDLVIGSVLTLVSLFTIRYGIKFDFKYIYTYLFSVLTSIIGLSLFEFSEYRKVK